MVIKSKEDIEDLFLYIKRYLKDEYNREFAVKYIIDDYYKIYIDKKSYNIALEAFADYLIRNYVFFFVQDYMDSEYNDDISLLDLLVESIINYKNRLIVNKIIDDMSEFSKLFKEINIAGYLIFTFRNYESLIDQAIGEAIILYNAEEEYKKFLALISDYIDDCCPKIDTLHIIKQTDGSYMYLDIDLKNIKELYWDKIKDELGDEEYTSEDEMLCVLINLKPDKINLHLKEQEINMNFIFTLEAIFGDRIRICSNGCRFCKS